MKPRLRLKRTTGWFAAGREVADALALLSDAAFKLYVWLCLHADRNRGVLNATYEELASALRKSDDEICAMFQELIRQGVCHRREDRSIEIIDDFWPYHREALHLPPESISAYVETVKRLFLARACVQSSFSIADRKLAMRLQVEEVPIEHVERAIHMGCLLKYASLINHLGRWNSDHQSALLYFAAGTSAAARNFRGLLEARHRETGKSRARVAPIASGPGGFENGNELMSNGSITFSEQHIRAPPIDDVNNIQA